MSDAVQASTLQSRRKRRTKYVIAPSFQWKYALLTGAAVFFIAAILSSVLYGVLHYQARMRSIQPETNSAQVGLIILGAGIAFAAVSAIGTALWCIVVTHRFCGPLYVMRAYMDELAQGRIPRPRALRKKDECKEFYAGFVHAMDALRAARVDDVTTLDRIMTCARSGLEGATGSGRHVLEQILDQATAMRDSAQQTVEGGGTAPSTPSFAEAGSLDGPVPLAADHLHNTTPV